MFVGRSALEQTRRRLGVFLDQISFVPDCIRLTWAATGLLTVAWGGLLVVQGVAPLAGLYLTRAFVDNLVEARAAGGSWDTVQPLLLVALAAAGVMLLAEALHSAAEWIRAAQQEMLRDHISSLVHQRSVAIDLGTYESPDYFDRLYRIQEQASHQTIAFVDGMGALLQNTITLLGIAAVLVGYAWWLPVVIVISALPAFSVLSVFKWRYHRWWKETTQDRRWADYYDLMQRHPQPAAEVRLFELGGHFQTAFKRLRLRLRTERLALVRQQGLARLGAGVSALVLPGIVMAWMVWRTLQGRASFGDLALFYQALTRGQTLIRSLLDSVGQIYNTSLYLDALFEFLELRPAIVDPPEPRPATPPVREIRFRQVTFHYPGSQRAVLDHLELTIPARQVVAIVGANGAGKSTLLKLLCRFYDPDEGSIELDGADIRSLRVTELRRLVTVVFQLPVPFHATVAENIAVSDQRRPADRSAVERAAKASGAHDFVSQLPLGYDTLLGKVFANGTELSGGEWQRVALARAFYRSAPIIILDEPTSHLDPWAEAEWFDRFSVLARGRTGIIITHRFTVAMRADVIHVMDRGRIVESGSHQELLARGGMYAESWRAQMRAGVSDEPDVEEPVAVTPHNLWSGRDGTDYP